MSQDPKLGHGNDSHVVIPTARHKDIFAVSLVADFCILARSRPRMLVSSLSGGHPNADRRPTRAKVLLPLTPDTDKIEPVQYLILEWSGIIPLVDSFSSNQPGLTSLERLTKSGKHSTVTTQYFEVVIEMTRQGSPLSFAMAGSTRAGLAECLPRQCRDADRVQSGEKLFKEPRSNQCA
jgi:hypothetical protein